MTDRAKSHPFSADRPITHSADDRLGRTGFADSLASAIRGWKGNDSLVIALYGSWGSGKSSIKNLLTESLRKSKKSSPEIVEFNPWQWAGQEQLAEAFFREIGILLGRADKSPKGKQRAAKWQTYGTYLTLGANMAKSLKVVLPLLGIPGANLLELAAEGLQQSAEVTKEGSEGLKARSDALEQGLADIKKDILDALRTLKKPILVVVDDVDRLSTDEIKLLFQLVKANADFPNMIYLLLFQRDIVERSLEKLAPISGREFLEKIVQVGFDVPKIERSRLERILFTSLDKLLSEGTDGKRFNQQRWQNMFIGGLRSYFKTLRDVHRYLSMLSFHVSLFHERKSLNVNPLDLISLEVLRVFEPDVYQAVSENKLIVTGHPTSLSQKWGDETRNWVASVVNALPEPRREQVREILKQLFPKVDWALSNYGYGDGFEDRWFRDLRVCHSDLFDRYFHFAIPEGDISQAELDLVLSLASNREGLVDEFLSLHKRGLLEVALDRLEAYKEKIELKYADSFVTAIFDIGDSLDFKRRGFYELQPEMHAIRIVHWYLKQEGDVARRSDILKRAMTDTQGLYLPIMKTSLEDDKRERKQDPDAFLITEEVLGELKKICLQKIRSAAETNKLKDHPRLLSILYRWKEWASPEEPRNWVEHFVGSKDGLLSFLKSLVQESSVSGSDDYAARIYRYIRLQSVEDFISPKTIEAKLKKISFDKLADDEKEAVRAFQKALERRQEGKSDDDWDHDDDSI